MQQIPPPSHEESAVPRAARLRAASAYLGVAAIAIWITRKPRDKFEAHHVAQALGIFLLLACVGVFFGCAVLALSAVMVRNRAFYEYWHLEGNILNVSRKLLLCWGVFWAFGLGSALLGKAWHMPLAATLARRAGLIRAAAVLWIVLYALLGTAAALALRANTLLRSDAVPGQVYCLYHDNGTFPRWVFALGFYRIAEASNAHLGARQVVMLPLTRESFARAAREGRFVFVGAHGVRSGLLIGKGAFAAKDAAGMKVNPALRYIYIAGCDSGAQQSEWATVLAPAEVITFNRLTPTIEHIWWLWSEGPRKVRAL